MKKILTHLGYLLIGALIWGAVWFVIYATEHHLELLSKAFAGLCLTMLLYLSGLFAYDIFKSLWHPIIHWKWENLKKQKPPSMIAQIKWFLFFVRRTSSSTSNSNNLRLHYIIFWRALQISCNSSLIIVANQQKFIHAIIKNLFKN